MKYLATTYFAQTYGSCAYGAGGYDDANCNASTTTTTGSTSGGGLLTNTGFDIALIVTIACTIIFATLLVRFWKRPATKAK